MLDWHWKHQSDGDPEAVERGLQEAVVKRRDGSGALLIKWSIDDAVGKCRQNQSKQEGDPKNG